MPPEAAVAAPPPSAPPAEASQPEASPSSAASPADGLGANEVADPKRDEAFSKLQSEKDKALARAQKLEDQVAALSARQREVVGAQQLDAMFAKLPDPILEPDQFSRGLQDIKAYANARIASDNRINLELFRFAAKTGRVILPNDERLYLKEGGEEGWRKFRSSLWALDPAAEEKKAGGGVDLEKIKADLKRELAAELGVDRFDGGAGQGGGVGLTLQSYQAMSFSERQKLKRDNPRAVDEMLRRHR